MSHIVLYGARDAPQALYAALTVAAAHGRAATVCVGGDPEISRAQILQRSGLMVASDLSGLFSNNNDSAASCAAVNQFVEAQQRVGMGNFSTTHFATWGRSVSGRPTQGFDHAIGERMLSFCMDSAAADWGTTQRRILQRYEKLSFGFGWWTKEGPDIAALSGLGLTWLGGGHNLALYSRLPALPLPSPPSHPALSRSGVKVAVPAVATVPISASIAVFSFTQGDAASFDQKFLPANLHQRSRSVGSQ